MVINKLPSCLGFLFSVVFLELPLVLESFFELPLVIWSFFELPLTDFGVLLGVTEFSLDGRFGVLDGRLLGDPLVVEASDEPGNLVK